MYKLMILQLSLQQNLKQILEEKITRKMQMVKKKVYPVLSHTLKLDHNLYIAPTLPVTHKGKTKPKGIKRFNDLITFEINIPNLMACID